MTDSTRPFCFECGNQLAYVNGSLVYAVRDYHGTPVRLHKDCAKQWDADKPVTVQTREEPPHE